VGSGRTGKWEDWEVGGLGSGRTGKWEDWEVGGLGSGIGFSRVLKTREKHPPTHCVIMRLFEHAPHTTQWLNR